VRGAAGPHLARGRQELEAAEALLEAGLPSQAVSRAYLAGLHAASATLAVIGERPVTRVGVISAFDRLVVGKDGIDHGTGRILRKLYEDRNEVDYWLVEAPVSEARRAIADAARLLEAADRWIGLRPARSQLSVH
jgi:uncharacterized protein (UPF0332 family)